MLALCVVCTGVDIAKVCPECWRDLSRTTGRGGQKKGAPVVPKNSLVRVDTGKVPSHLPALTALEAKFISALWSSREVYLMKPEGRQDRPNDCYQKSWKGHVLAFPQACGRQLQAVFPPNPEDAAASVNVVFLSAVGECADIAAMASRSPALQVSLIAVR